MRKLLACWLLVPFIGLSQTKDVINVSRYFPKIDKVAEFEKAFIAHAKKYHSTNWKWRVFEIQTGPDAGGLQVVEGPNTWDEIDKRGNLGADHMNDWNKNIAPNLIDKYQNSYVQFREDLSSVPLDAFTDKIAILHIYPKPGWADKVEGTIKKAQKVWAADKQSVAVYESSASGPFQYILVYRYPQGLKERDKNFRKPFKERYETAHGTGSFDNFLGDIREYTDNSWSEMLFARNDLSSQ